MKGIIMACGIIVVLFMLVMLVMAVLSFGFRLRERRAHPRAIETFASSARLTGGAGDTDYPGGRASTSGPISA